MELACLIEGLSRVEAYPHVVDSVHVIQTHISVVCLAGPFVYKLKKPVNLGFLDFSTLEKRRHDCLEEVRLNRRLAPNVYLGVVPVTLSLGGMLMEGSGEAIEWAVKMRRLPEGTSLLDQLERGEVDPGIIEALAERIASFHRQAEGSPRIAAFGRFDVVAQNARDNFEQSRFQVGRTVSLQVYDRLRTLMEETLDALRPLIEARAEQGVPRDTHGDLHLDHVFFFPDHSPPDDLIVIDCIAFSERFRCSDPVADSAFLVMDLLFHGRRDLAAVFAAAYLRARNDPDGATVLPFYVVYRALIRAKVEGIEALEEEVAEEERRTALTRARAHWLLALGELELPAERPCLVLVGGLPGSGKSTLARGLAEEGRFTVIRSDVVRKQLAGLDLHASARGEVDAGIYTPEWTRRTYSTCLQQAERLLEDGQRAIVDASFGDDGLREEFVHMARRLCVPTRFLLCSSTPEGARERIRRRTEDVSDADVTTYDHTAARWQPFSREMQAVVSEISTNEAPSEAVEAARRILKNAGML